jgi:mannosyltransferase OCH1-like enzyme
VTDPKRTGVDIVDDLPNYQQHNRDTEVAGGMQRAAATRIPKLLHYVWVGGSPIPSRFRKNIRSWQRHNPSFEIKLWNESNINLSEPFIQEALRQRAWAKLSDFVRLLVVEQYGGIYLDTDVEVCRPFDDLLTCGCFFGVQSHRDEDDPVCNAVFGALPHHPFIRQVIDAFPVSTTQDLYCVGTGPELVSALLLARGLPRRSNIRICVSGVDIFPPVAFYPYHWMENFTPARVTPDTFAVHHWDMSWHHPHATLAVQMLRGLVKSYPWLYRPIRRIYQSIKRSSPTNDVTL